MRAKKFVPYKKGDRNRGIYYLCQPNTYVIAITAAHQIHEQCHRCWVDIGSIPPFLCLLFLIGTNIFALTYYVDVCLTGESTPHTRSYSVRTELNSMLAKGGLLLRIWRSNSQAVLAAIPEKLKINRSCERVAYSC